MANEARGSWLTIACHDSVTSTVDIFQPLALHKSQAEVFVMSSPRVCGCAGTGEEATTISRDLSRIHSAVWQS